MAAKKKKTASKKKKIGRLNPNLEDRPLTGKQEAWCRWMTSALVNFNNVDAARRAGYKGNMVALSRISYENRNKPNVAKRLKELTDKALSGADVTIEATLRKLSVIHDKALEAGQYAAAARCAELHGKYLKMFTDRIEHVSTIEDVPLPELARLLSEIAESGSIDLAQLTQGNGPEDGGLSTPAGNQTTH